MDVNNEFMIDTTFLKRFTDGIDPPFCPEILDTDVKLTNIPWLTVPVKRIEPDDWDMFWKLWEEWKRTSSIYNEIWDTICIWSNPNLTEQQLKTLQEENIKLINQLKVSIHLFQNHRETELLQVKLNELELEIKNSLEKIETVFNK